MTSKRNVRAHLAVLILALITGCTTSTAMRTSGQSYPATDPAKVRVFLSEKPADKYIEIGKVTVDKYGVIGIVAASGDKINQLLREQAAKIGGDAIINVSEDFASVSGVVIVFTKKQ